MIPGSFEYHRPVSVGDAVALLSRHGDDSRVLAGGHSLIPMMKLRFAVPDHLIDLQDVPDLQRLTIGGDGITIGAMVRQADVIGSDALARACPILREAAEQIADPQIRNCGTLGGNVANGDPGNDMPAVMQALDATYLVTGPDGDRAVAARDFYRSAFVTALADDEILTAIRIPAPAAGHGWCYRKQKRKVGDYATAAAAVLLSMAGGVCTAAAVALTNMGETPLVAADAAALLTGSRLDADTIARAVAAATAITDPAEDGRGPADFRRHVAGVMLTRAIAAARDRARG